jgi:acyl-homoserine-lactone acylase
LAEPIAVLRGWDYRWNKASVPMTVAQFWGDALWPKMLDRTRAHEDMIQNLVQKYLTPQQQLELLSEAVDRLTQDFGTWNIAWGEVNRYQRLTSQIAQAYRDDQPSQPVSFASSRWGSLAAFEASRREGTKRYYGASGNSFVAAVEFGPKVRAVAVSAGGESGHVGDKHFTDQAQRYGAGALRPVYFYPEDLKGHIERTYRPGQ